MPSSVSIVILILDGSSPSIRGEPSLYQVISGSGLPVHEHEATVSSPSSGFFLVNVRSPIIVGTTGDREREEGGGGGGGETMV